MGILILELNILSSFLRERKMNMRILWIIPIMGVFLYLALFITNFKI
jgi:hypothetical protein